MTTLLLLLLQLPTTRIAGTAPTGLFDWGVFLAGAAAVLGTSGVVLKWLIPLFRNGRNGSAAQQADAKADGVFQGRVLALFENGQAQQERIAGILNAQIREGQAARQVLSQLTAVLEGVAKSLTEHTEASDKAMGQVDAIYKNVVLGERRLRPQGGGG